MTEFNKKFHLEESKTFCMAPWVHTHIWPNGNVYPCCMGDASESLDNYKTTGDLKQVWNGPKYKQLRINTLNETKTGVCKRCYEQDENGKVSLRQSLNKEFAEQYELVETTKDDGHLETLELRYLDIRFSNICNLACRTCGPDLSSQWGTIKAKEFPERTDLGLLRIESNSKSKEFWDDLEQYISKLTRIYFAGGEPLLMKEHYDLLEYLIAHDRTQDIELSYNTNFTTFSFKGKSVFDYWKQFKNVRIGASLDASGRQGEYLRYGLVWDEVIENLEKLKNECPNVDFRISPTVSVFNAERIIDFYYESVAAGYIKQYYFNFNVLQFPVEYRISNLPIANKNRILNKISLLETEISNYKLINTRSKIASYLLGELTHFRNALMLTLAPEIQESNIKSFNSSVSKIDADRNESVWDVFPELITMKR